jgi:glycosyltransferase involved in cell wall biosynthesis
VRPPDRTPPALGLVQLNNGTSAWRIFHPMDYLNRRGYMTAYGINGDPRASALVADADLVIMHRLAWKPEDQGNALLWRRLLHGSGKALCYEVDDDILTESIVERIHSTTQLQKTDEEIHRERRQHLFAIQICDGVICSTEGLAEICRALTDRPVIVVPNAIDLHRFRLVTSVEPPRSPSDPITVAWIGGNRPDRDAEALGIAWNRISRKYPSVRFRVGGYPLGALVNAVPPDRLDLVPWRPIEAYQRTFANVDIGCAPLNDEPFNRSKSSIKAMEYAAAGAAVCASPVAYSGLIQDGITGLVCRSEDDWTVAIQSLIEDPQKRELLAGNLLQEVESKHSLAVNAWRWPEAWATIVSDFRVRLLSSSRGGGSTLPRRMEYDNVSSPVLRVQ